MCWEYIGRAQISYVFFVLFESNLYETVDAWHGAPTGKISWPGSQLKLKESYAGKPKIMIAFTKRFSLWYIEYIIANKVLSLVCLTDI